jgi:hypothetical protein
LLYSLELVRQSIPTEGDAPDVLEDKTAWCKAFLLRGGFAHLFVLLSRIQQDESRGRVERACLGHLLRIMFYFMRTELQQSLGKSMDSDVTPLRFSVGSSTTLESVAPFEKLASVMFRLLTERARRANEAAVGGVSLSSTSMTAVSSGGGKSDADDADITRFAAYLLSGSILRQPHLLDALADEPGFSENLLGLLCCADAGLKTHVVNQLTSLCKEFVNDPERPARRAPAPFFLGQALGAIPVLLRNDAMGRQCAPIFSLITELFGYVLSCPASNHSLPQLTRFL